MRRRRIGRRFDAGSRQPAHYWDDEAVANRSRLARLRDETQNRAYREQYRRAHELLSKPVRPFPPVTVRKPRTVGLRVSPGFVATKPMHRDRSEVLRCVKEKLRQFSQRAGAGAGVRVRRADRREERRRVIQAARKAC